MRKKLLEKCRAFFRWIWQECRDWRTVVLLIIVVAVLYLPVWGGYLLSLLFHWNWAAVMATAVLVFWAGPFTPFFPLCITLTLSIKKGIEVWRRKRSDKKKDRS